MKYGSCLELKCSQLRSEDVSARHVTREEIGGELDAVKVAFNTLGHHLDGARFCQSRRTLDQKVPIGKYGDQ